jgi:hypothetical protein
MVMYLMYKASVKIRRKTVKFLNSHSGGVESKLGPLGTSATSGLLYLPRVIVRMKNVVE